MSGLKLGDIVLDPARAVYIPSLNAVVCNGLFSALKVGIGDGLRSAFERIEYLLERYKPESFIVLEPVCRELPFQAVAKRWAKRTKFHIVGPVLDKESCLSAESLGIEVHHDLLWGKYRFAATSEDASFDMGAYAVVGGSSFEVKLSKRGLKSQKLSVFLKGIGRIHIPDFNPKIGGQTVFCPEFERSDVFAVGHHRVLPLGKVLDLRRFRSRLKGDNLPLSKLVLGKHTSESG